MKLKETYELAEIHDGWESVYRANPLQDRLNSRLMDRALAYAKPAPDAQFLDAGCGVGYHSLAIGRRGFRCIGIDISENVLKEAARNLERAGLEERVSFRCESLEDLPFPEQHFDVVHCRGVLMHVPEWERALQQLCRVLKVGGKLIVMESNSWAVETYGVRLLRHVGRARSRMVNTPGGYEFWAEMDGQPVVTRIAHVRYLKEQLARWGVQVRRRFASEFFDINRFQEGMRRNLAIRFNRLWFTLRLPACMAMGNCFIGEKTAEPKERQLQLFVG